MKGLKCLNFCNMYAYMNVENKGDATDQHPNVMSPYIKVLKSS